MTKHDGLEKVAADLVVTGRCPLCGATFDIYAATLLTDDGFHYDDAVHACLDCNGRFVVIAPPGLRRKRATK